MILTVHYKTPANGNAEHLRESFERVGLVFASYGAEVVEGSLSCERQTVDIRLPEEKGAEFLRNGIINPFEILEPQAA